jgi:16S rRNA (guanine966-N2)-methyltransferase
MRISGGTARGIPLLVPKGGIVRPATDGLRQAVFSSLGVRVAGARFLDLFAGSGAYGLEALSRGASGGVFVERNPKALESLRRNLDAVCKCLGRDARSEIAVIPADATTAPVIGGAPDLVFVDPPYELIGSAAAPLFARLLALMEPRPDALVVFEMPGECDLAPAGWRAVKRLGKGARQPTAVFFVPDSRRPAALTSGPIRP